METLRFDDYCYCCCCCCFDLQDVWVSDAKLDVVVKVLPTSYLNACLSHKMLRLHENVECSKYNFLCL